MRKGFKIKNLTSYVVFDLIGKTFPFLLLPLFTSFLGVEEFGIVTEFLIYQQFIVPFLSMGADAFLANNFYRENTSSVKFYVLHLKFIVVPLLLICSIGAYWSGRPIFAYLPFTALLYCFFQFKQMENQLHKRMQAYIGYALFYGVVINVISVVLVFIIPSADIRLLPLAMCGLILYVGILFSDRMDDFWGDTKSFYCFATPLLGHQYISVFKLNLDKLMLVGSSTAAAVGVYGLSIQLAAALNIVLLSVNRAATPYLYKRFSQKKPYFLIRICVATIGLILLAIFLWVDFIEHLLLALFSSDYSEAGQPTLILICGNLLLIPYLYIMQILTFHQKTVAILTASIWSLLLYSATAITLDITTPNDAACLFFLGNTLTLTIFMATFYKHEKSIYLHEPAAKENLSRNSRQN